MARTPTGKGFVQSLAEYIYPGGKHLVLLGAGGAARAIAVETALVGLQRITVVNRSEPRGQQLVQLVNERTPAQADFVPWIGDYQVPSECALVIQATSIGLFSDVDARVPIDCTSLRPTMVVVDVIPNSLTTRLTREAAKRGCTLFDGLGMLVNQGVISIKYWTGMNPTPP